MVRWANPDATTAQELVQMAQQRAARLAQKLQELGIDSDELLEMKVSFILRL